MDFLFVRLKYFGDFNSYGSWVHYANKNKIKILALKLIPYKKVSYSSLFYYIQKSRDLDKTNLLFMDPKFETTIVDIDLLNAKDPNLEIENGKLIPKELLYSKRMTDMLAVFCPEASEVLKIAVRAQHIQRWTSPRENYPMDRKGYLLWRTELKKFHGALTAGIMKNNGYPEEEMEKVDGLINKRRMKTDPEAQTLEDVVCLVFLRYYFDDFIAKHPNEKIIDIVQKTWKKMSEKGHVAAMGLKHSEKALGIIGKALEN